MDGCSWVPSQARGSDRAVFSGDMPWHKASTSNCDDSDRLHRHREEQDVVISSQLQQQLEQIYRLMDMEQEHELHLDHAVPLQSPSQQQRWSPSSSSPPFRSFALISSDETSSLVLSASSATTSFCQQPAQASSSLDTPFSPLPISYLETNTIPNLQEIMSQPRHKDGHADSGTSAFRQYVRHLRPKKKLKPAGACGQRAIKTAMSVLVKMNSAKLSEWPRQSSRSEMTAALYDESNNIQLQHLLSERKRREKINNSFDDLRNVLPRSSKRDKTSVLMRARDYINSLKSRVSELEEKGMALESQLWMDYGDE